MIDPLFGTAIGICLAVLLLSAAWQKFTSHADFVAVLGNYRLLAPWLVAPLAAILPGLEATLAVGWLLDWPRRPVAFATAALLLAYAAAIAVNLRRGRGHIDCGCSFGAKADGGQPLSGWLVARNLILALLAGIAALPDSGRDLGAGDALTVAAATLTGVLLYAGASQLIRNAAHATRRTPRG